MPGFGGHKFYFVEKAPLAFSFVFFASVCKHPAHALAGVCRQVFSSKARTVGVFVVRRPFNFDSVRFVGNVGSDTHSISEARSLHWPEVVATMETKLSNLFDWRPSLRRVILLDG